MHQLLLMKSLLVLQLLLLFEHLLRGTRMVLCW
jgi:hypothetical protein